MITCFLKYVIDPDKVSEFEQYGRLWIKLVEKFGGKHHGYFMPHEGANNIGYALFSFTSLAEYEHYRQISMTDEECQEAYNFAQATKCIISYERTFLRPVLNQIKG